MAESEKELKIIVFPDQIDKGKTEQQLKTSKLLKPTATQRKL